MTEINLDNLFQEEGVFNVEQYNYFENLLDIDNNIIPGIENSMGSHDNIRISMLVMFKMIEYFKYKFDLMVLQGDSVKDALLKVFSGKYKKHIYPDKDACNGFFYEVKGIKIGHEAYMKYSVEEMIEIYLNDKTELGDKLKIYMKHMNKDLHKTIHHV